MWSDQSFLLALKKGLAKSVNIEERTIKFAEVGVLAFPEGMPSILSQAGFQGTLLDILTTFRSGLDKVLKTLLQTSQELTSDKYGALARVLLGFQAVQIFGSSCITPSLKQIVKYVPYYIDKALADGKMVGLPITLANFSDATMEIAHKQNKRKSLLFSGGRAGPRSRSQYKEQVIRQQFQNVFEITNRESTPQKSSSRKAEKKRKAIVEKESGVKRVVIKPILLITFH